MVISMYVCMYITLSTADQYYKYFTFDVLLHVFTQLKTFYFSSYCHFSTRLSLCVQCSLVSPACPPTRCVPTACVSSGSLSSTPRCTESPYSPHSVSTCAVNESVWQCLAAVSCPLISKVVKTGSLIWEFWENKSTT